MIRNLGFVDGNKRTATALARWLLFEGYRLSCGQDELVEMANMELELERVEEWLEAHSAVVKEPSGG